MRLLVDYAQWTYLSEYAPVYVDFDGGGITPIGVGEIPLMEFSFCRNRD